MLGIDSSKAQLYDYDYHYESIANETIKNLYQILGKQAIQIEHVGSTAIRGILAKPIIDIVIGVKQLSIAFEMREQMEKHHFLFSKTKLNNTMIAFKCEANSKRTHNIYFVLFGGERWDEFILFRDYLNKHPECAKEYEKLKLLLAEQFENHIHNYTEGKSEFISDILEKAKQEVHSDIYL